MGINKLLPKHGHRILYTDPTMAIIRSRAFKFCKRQGPCGFASTFWVYGMDLGLNVTLGYYTLRACHVEASSAEVPFERLSMKLTCST